MPKTNRRQRLTAGAPAWLKRVLYSEWMTKIEKAAGFKLKEMIACGFWGCVFTTKDKRFVVKITIDPTEGPMQAEIGKRQRAREYGYDGFVRVLSVAVLSKIFESYGRKGKVYVIVREEVEPFIDLFRSYERYGAHGPKMTEISPSVPVKLVEQAIKQLGFYKAEAGNWHKMIDGRQKDYLLRQMGNRLDAIGAAFPYLGQSMQMFHYADPPRPLSDVHYGNIGIRRHVMPGDLKGDTALGAVVIFDPGHTPSGGLAEVTRTINPGRPRRFYRGTRKGGQRSAGERGTGDKVWDSALWVASDVKHARMYAGSGSSVLTCWQAKPSAKILYEGTRPYISLQARVRKAARGRPTPFVLMSGVLRLAKRSGYDAVWFRWQDAGTAVLNKAAFSRCPKRLIPRGNPGTITKKQRAMFRTALEFKRGYGKARKAIERLSRLPADVIARHATG